MSSFFCDDNFDCPGNLECVRGVPPDLRPLANGSASICDCNLRFGWTAETPDDEFCTGFGGHSYYLLAVNSILMLISLGAISFDVISAIIVHRGKGLKSSPAALTLVFVNTTFLVLFLFRLISTLIVLSPEESTVPFAGLKQSPIYVAELICITLFLFFALVSFSNLAIVCIDTVKVSRSLSISAATKDRTRKYIRIGQAVVTILFIISFSIGGNIGATAGGGIGFLGVLVLWISLVYSYRIINKLEKELITNDNTDSAKILSKLANLIVAKIVLLFIVLIGILGYAALSAVGFADICPTGSVCMYIVFRDIAIIGATFALLRLDLFLRAALGFSRSSRTMFSTGSKKSKTVGSPNPSALESKDPNSKIVSMSEEQSI